VVIESSNLTQGRLFTNYELCSVTELDLQNTHEKKQFDEIITTLNNYSNCDSSCCKQFSSELLDKLVRRDMIPVERMDVSQQSLKLDDLYLCKKTIFLKIRITSLFLGAPNGLPHLVFF